MQYFATIFATFALYASVSGLPKNRKAKAGAAAAVAGTAGATTAVAASTGTTGSVTRGASTLVLFEVGGIAGNECLTFRNNGTSMNLYRITCSELSSNKDGRRNR